MAENKELSPEEQIAQLREQLRKQEEETAKVIDDLQSELEKKTNLADQVDPILTYKKKEYRLLKKFRHNGEIFDLAALKENPDIIAEILDIKGQQILEEVK